MGTGVACFAACAMARRLITPVAVVDGNIMRSAFWPEMPGDEFCGAFKADRDKVHDEIPGLGLLNSAPPVTGPGGRAVPGPIPEPAPEYEDVALDEPSPSITRARRQRKHEA